MSETKVVNSGPGLASLLTVLFVGLKLTGNITWSWWWVFSPLWITVGIVLAVAAAALAVYVLAKD